MKTRYAIKAKSHRNGILETDLGSFRTEFWANAWCAYHNLFNSYSHRWDFVVVRIDNET